MKAFKRWTSWTALAAIVAVTSAYVSESHGTSTAAAPIEITVYKSPTCGCCAKWIEHLTASGFKVTTRNMDNVDPVKDQNHVPATLRSCHTAVVNGYVIEGHVPAADIQRMLREHPKIVGLSVPGMVTGSPGMEGAHAEAYDVVAFGDGKTSVFAKH
ncbi:MAG: DUF411 domain-containing protein [Gemmatimonadota bacterium]